MNDDIELDGFGVLCSLEYDDIFVRWFGFVHCTLFR